MAIYKPNKKKMPLKLNKEFHSFNWQQNENKEDYKIKLQYK